MKYSQIEIKMHEMFPGLHDMNDYRPQDGEPNAIHVWMNDGRELVFSYQSENKWFLESYQHYLDRKTIK